MYFRTFLSAFVFACLPLAAIADTARTVIVDFSTATLRVYEAGTVVVETPVVLPKGDYYPVPINGTIYRSEMGPRWTPTANMHRDHPGRYRQSYGPYEPGNAMGHCKLSIDFERSDEYPILRTVRIHGNAQPADLGLRRSRSCIRIPDALCGALVSATSGTNGPVQVSFVR